MSEPEIARRCLSCGASVRQSAAFCPQCGQVLGKREPDYVPEAQLHAPDETTTIDESQRDRHYDNETAPTVWAPAPPEAAIVRRDEESAEPAPPLLLETRPIGPNEMPPAFETRPLITNTAPPDQTLADLPTPNIVGPDKAAASGNQRQVMRRVEKIRKVSSVMIDQAAYDPSLRFLLVAAFLFIMFVMLMILSKVVG
jgi:zinc-ribbon domain